MSNQKIEQTLKKITRLPTLPTVLAQLSGMVSDPKTSAQDVGEAVGRDQALTARLLRLVNSSFYGFRQRIASIDHAVVILGFNALKNLVFTTSVVQLFPDTGNGRFDHIAFWEHSIGCAILARRLAGQANYPQVEEVFVAGLLHDVGKLVEDQFLHEEFSQVMDAVNSGRELMAEAEEKLLGLSHERIGELLCEQWNLPSSVQVPVAHHHRPSSVHEQRIETTCVHTGDVICRAMSLGCGGGDAVPVLDEDAWEVLGVPPSALEPLMDATLEEYEEIADLLAQV